MSSSKTKFSISIFSAFLVSSSTPAMHLSCGAALKQAWIYLNDALGFLNAPIGLLPPGTIWNQNLALDSVDREIAERATSSNGPIEVLSIELFSEDGQVLWAGFTQGSRRSVDQKMLKGPLSAWLLRKEQNHPGRIRMMRI